jgi:hypothetical protein
MIVIEPRAGNRAGIDDFYDGDVAILIIVGVIGICNCAINKLTIISS